MHNIFTLLKLEFKNRKLAGVSGKKAFWRACGSILSIAIAYLVILYGARMYFEMFGKAGMNYAALVLVFTVMFLFLCFSGISSVTKVLYFKGDNEMLMRFPVTGAEVFISKTLFLFLSQLALTAAVVVPFLIAYAESVDVDISYYTAAPLVILFLALIPFFISNLLAIPFMHLSNKVRHRFALMIIGMVLLMVLLFSVYMLLFENIVTYVRDSEFSVFSPEVVNTINDMVYYFVPTKFFAGMLTGLGRGMSFIVLGSITLIAGILTVTVTVKLYQKTLLKNVEIEGSAYKHPTRNKERSIFGSILKKEFLQVFRSVNYSFQYFVLACTMPFMVYSCNNIAIQIGKNDIGSQIVPGLTLLVMLIFATVITSFSATSVTREGNCFYHTKVMPVSVNKQMAVKFTMYFIVSFLANAVTVVVIIAFKQLTVKEALVIFAIVQGLAVALTLSYMKLDIRHPQFNLSGEGELVNNNRNTTTSILIGFVVALVEGMAGMFVAFVYSINWAYAVCSMIAGVVFLCSLAAYFAHLQRDYQRIT